MNHAIYNQLTLQQRQLVTERKTTQRDIADLEVARALLDHCPPSTHPAIMRVNFDARQIIENPDLLDDKRVYLAALEAFIVNTDDQLAHDLGLLEPLGIQVMQ